MNMNTNKHLLKNSYKILTVVVLVLISSFGFSQAITEVYSTYQRTSDCNYMLDFMFEGGMEPYSVEIDGPDTNIYYSSVSGGGNTLSFMLIRISPQANSTYKIQP